MFGLSITLIPMVIYLGIGLYQTGQMAQTASQSCLALARVEVRHTLQQTIAMCKSQNGLAQQMVNNTLSLAGNALKSAGATGFSQGETVQWRTVDQFTKQKKDIGLSKMTVGGQWLGQNRDPQKPSPVVDQVMELSQQTCTIFQRMNQQGDMLRVCTNVAKLDGIPAIGTYIPAVNPNGKPNAVVSTVLSGRTFRGRAFVVNAWYITAYEPIVDAGGQVVGVLYVGIKESQVQKAFWKR
jgi:hypothetical protein